MMHRLSPICLLAIAALALSFSTGHAQTGKKKKKELAVTIPDSLIVIREGAAYLSITVDRKKVDGDVTVEFEDLPIGITVVNKGRVIKEDKEGMTFKLKADDSTKPGDEFKIIVHAAADGRSNTVEVKLTVQEHELKTGGLIVMVISVGAVLILVTYCLIRVLTLPPVEVEETLKGPLEIDTGDTNNAD